MSGRSVLRPDGRQAIISVLGVVLILAGAAVPADAARSRWRGYDRPDVDLVLEGGITQPYGQLGEPYAQYLDEHGLGAELGYGVGARLRVHWSDAWAFSPSIRFEDFGDYASNLDDESRTPFAVKTSIVRYGVDLQYFLPTDRDAPQPFLSGGLALFHDRYRDEINSATNPSWSEESVNSFGFGLGGGVRYQALEISVTYNINRFETARLPFPFGVRADRNWDYLSFSFGFALPLDAPRR